MLELGAFPIKMFCPSVPIPKLTKYSAKDSDIFILVLLS
jgi:hypothetical protein